MAETKKVDNKPELLDLTTSKEEVDNKPELLDLTTSKEERKIVIKKRKEKIDFFIKNEKEIAKARVK